MIWVGGALGLAIAAGFGLGFGSWLLFAVLSLPLTVVSAVVVYLASIVYEQNRVREYPERIDALVQELVENGQLYQAFGVLTRAASLLQTAKPTPAHPKHELEARVKRWDDLSKEYLSQAIQRARSKPGDKR